MNEKELVGIEVAKYVKDGMTVGLGTGSTAYYFIMELGRRVIEENLHIIGVPTSIQTANLAIEQGIEIVSMNDVDRIDLTIDGTDEFDPNLNGIKGGGGAHLIEKIIAVNSKKVIWICDHTKKVSQLGAFPLPIEVIEDASRPLFNYFNQKGYKPVIRLAKDGSLYKTDRQNMIIDLQLEKIADPYQLADELIQLVGVVEHGLFLDIADHVIMSEGSQIKEYLRT